MKTIIFDLDNTIIDYRRTIKKIARRFIPNLNPRSTKEDIKHILLTLQNCPQEWYLIQSLCYGQEILSANIYPGFKKAASQLKKNGYELFIVSHKSKTCYSSLKHPLRESSDSFLKKSRIVPQLISPANVIYCSDQESKIATIHSLEPFLIIDDLEEILSSPRLEKFNRILFSQNKIQSIFSSYSWKEISTMTKLLSDGKKMSSIAPTSKHVILKIDYEDHPSLILKKYSNKSRLKREFSNLKIMQKANIENVAKAQDKGPDHLLLSYLPGKSLPSFDERSVQKIQYFFESFIKLPIRKQGTHSRKKRSDYFSHLKARLKNIPMELRSDLSSIYNYLLNNSELTTKVHQQVCYSDFSLNNILDDNGNLSFLDFESTGLDDPAKMVADFIFHPRNNEDNGTYLLASKLLDIYKKEDPTLHTRLHEIIDLIGFEWLLICISHLDKKSGSYSIGEIQEKITVITDNMASGRENITLTHNQLLSLREVGLL